MKFSVLLPVLAVLGGSLATPVVADPTFCQKYGSMDSTAQKNLLYSVVARAVLGNSTSTPPVHGIVASDSPILQYFNGSVQFRTNGPTPNFVQSYLDNNVTQGTGAQYAFGNLAAHLVQFFGTALGCNAADFQYAGVSNMTLVHQNMKIDAASNNYFITQLANSMLSLGVSSADLTNGVVPFLNTFNRDPALTSNATFPTGPYGAGQGTGVPATDKQVCNQPDCPTAPAAQNFCEKYSTILYGNANMTNEVNLITAVVARAVLGNATVNPAVNGIVAANSPILQYFNGSVQSRAVGTTPNFVQSYLTNGLNQGDGTAPYAFGVLAAHLVQFFGTALGCNGTSFAFAGNKNMSYVHAGMKITNAQETYFINQIANAALSFGATSDDVGQVGTLLKNFNRQPASTGNQVCNQPDCPCATGFSGDTCGNPGPNAALAIRPSTASMLVAAVAIIAGLLL